MNNTKQKHKKRAVVICPGRGTYNKDELGYLQRLHGDKQDLLVAVDEHRLAKGQVSIAELDQMPKYNMRLHTAGENASSLIYACAQGDFEDIDTELYDIVAVTGNSMGWYIALAVSGALKTKNAIELINTMGSMMSDRVIGGQLIYPVTDEHWQHDPSLKTSVDRCLAEVNALTGAEVYPSIFLGGYIVLGGNEKGLLEIERRLPGIADKYPMKLFNHAAFHTPLLADIASKAQQLLPSSMFETPAIPLIDGQGKIWQPHSTDLEALYRYTLGKQVTEPYNFSKAIEVALKEFAPDKLIIVGPGSTLGGAVGQCLVRHKWLNIESKKDFIEQQSQQPFVLAMGMPQQRKKVISTSS